MHKLRLWRNAFIGTMRSVRTRLLGWFLGPGSDLSPPPSSFGVDLTRLSEPRFFWQLPVFLFNGIDTSRLGRLESAPFSNLRPIFQDSTLI